MKLSTGLLTGIVSILLIGASSCTREYICQCEIAYSGRPDLPDTLINEYKLTNTQEKARKLCEDGSGEYYSETDGVKTVETCRLY